MLKSVRLKLSKIKYSGDSIGDDIRVEIETLGKFLRVDKKIKAGSTAEINREIGRFEIDQGIFQADVLITVIDKDLRFNDIGGTTSNIKIKLATAQSQPPPIKIQVNETRSKSGKPWGTKTAIFEITLEADSFDLIKYAPDESDGWLQAKIINSKTIVDLPAYLKVKIERIERGREYFTFLEGPYRGKTASINLDGRPSRFIFDARHEPMAQAKYSISKKIFILKGKKYKTVDYPDAIWGKGLYDIEIPDYAHRGGSQYPEAGRAKVWFKIGHSGARYLHTGTRSLGCMTIAETRRWMEIYSSLIKARKDDFKSVGILEVID